MRRDVYLEWSYAERCEASRNGERDLVRQWDHDSESSDRAYENWRNGGEFSDPNEDGRFH